MTGLLRVTLDPACVSQGQMLACEVVGGGERYTAMLAADLPYELEVPPGTYVIRATMPSGTVLVAAATVEADTETSMVLGRVLAPVEKPGPEWGDRGLLEAWRPDVLGPDVLEPDLLDADVTGERGVGPRQPTTPAPEPPPLLPRRRVWARLWLGSLTSTWSDAVSTTPEGAVVVEMSTGVGPYTVQVGGPDVAWRTVCLPPAYGATVRVVASEDPTGFDDGVHVSVAGRSPLAASMLGYLASGQMDSAWIVAPELVAQAKRLFQEKMASPEGAAAAGYFLLRAGQQETIGDWPENFANWFGWLPDAQVIHAAQLLRRPEAPERDVARMRLLDAVAAGVPRYTEGVRVLLESLQALAWQDPQDQDVADALAEARRYASACDWSAVHTTYWASRPGEPTLERPTGWPSDPSGWVELPSAEFWLPSENPYRLTAGEGPPVS